MICSACSAMGYVRAHPTSRVVTPDHVTHEYVEDFRHFVMQLREESQWWDQPITCGSLREFVTDLLRDLPGTITNRQGEEVMMNMTPLNAKSFSYWVRDYLFTPRPPLASLHGRQRPRIHKQTRQRLACLASVLKAADAHSGALWGMRPANDEQHTPHTFKIGGILNPRLRPTFAISPATFEFEQDEDELEDWDEEDDDWCKGDEELPCI